MSANNFLEINKETFEVWDKDIETNNGFLIGKATTLDGAFDIAEKYMKENIVEYGIMYKRGKFKEEELAEKDIRVEPMIKN